ncbi:MAG: PilN domain-containing protein [Candidatus Loosdrechtia sp.]|uniref:PilN domain-containing protein n=1 Tax=Candidatus Loosdrechtia sp. TaxID=3101272 RepID=UPI003A640F87|nr:MAG: PilN domain-containing protein [Candidatus Jettenia sp. AMX2]
MNKTPFAILFSQKAMGLSFKGSDLIVTIIHRKLFRYSWESFICKDFTDKEYFQPDTVFLQLKKFSGPVILSWPREHTIIREIQYPNANLKELKEALRYQLDSFIPFSNDEVYYDIHFNPHSLSHAEDNTKVLIVAVKKQELDTIQMKLQTLGIIPSRVIISSFSFLPVLNVEEGPAAVIHKNTISYSYNLYENNRLVSSLIVKTKNELMQRLRNDSPAKVLLANIDSTEFLSHEDNISLQLLDDYAESHGAAQYGLLDNPCTLDLVKTHKRQRNPQIVMMCFLAGFLILFAFLIPYIQKINNSASINDINARIHSLRKDVSAVEKLHERITVLDELIGKITGIEEKYVPRIDVILELAKILPDDAWVRAVSFESNSFEIEGDAVSSTNLIPILENSPLFSGVGLTSPVTKTQGGRERFRIKGTIEKHLIN